MWDVIEAKVLHGMVRHPERWRYATLLQHVLGAGLLGMGVACGASPEEAAPMAFRLVADSADAALLSVSGTTGDDVWLVGADAGQGPPVLHWDGAAWSSLDSGVNADLWWVQALPGGPVYFAGGRSTLLAQRAGVFERMSPPGLARDTIYGVWAAAEDDVYAVGSAAGRNGFVWHHDGSAWRQLPLPEPLPVNDDRDGPALFKVWGASSDDVWVVGDGGVVLRGSARAGFRVIASGSDDRLFTVHGAAGQVLMVGGSGNGLALEADGAALSTVTPPGASLLQGVHVAASGAAFAVGLGGNVYTRPSAAAEWSASLPDTPVQSLHSVWVDPEGSVWTVGGNVLSDSLDGGVALLGASRAGVEPLVLAASEEPSAPVCSPDESDPAPGTSVARRWIEQLLGAIRRDLPRAPVHARNLFHLSVALWDAWAAYDGAAIGHVVRERARATDVNAARREALSYAAFRVLSQRYAEARGGALSRACFLAQLRALGHEPLDAAMEGDAPRAVGDRVGRAVLDAFAVDGANEADDYADAEAYPIVNGPLSVDLPGTVADDPNHWQPLLITQAVSANGIRLGSGVQAHLGAHWGRVTPFALERAAPEAPYVEVGDAPLVLDAAGLDAVVDVIARSGWLGVADGVRWQISADHPVPARADAAAPGLNPISSTPYVSRSVLRGDHGRAVVDYWTNGPAQETSPGHWNVLAHAVADDPSFERRLFGVGDPLDPLAWDVHVYLALNGALHDAAVAAWELKRLQPGARPITLVRHLAGLGQRSDPEALAHDPDGLPLVPGSIELITASSSAPGERHAALARYTGELALRAWPGEPGDRERASGVVWIRGKDWMPYQPRGVVSPAFPGHVSDQSAFAHAAAAVLGALTGSGHFPGGLGRARVERLRIEQGPAEPVELEWATYADAADQAGDAGVWSGTQLAADVSAGRRLGVRVGELAIERARGAFGGAR